MKIARHMYIFAFSITIALIIVILKVDFKGLEKEKLALRYNIFQQIINAMQDNDYSDVCINKLLVSFEQQIPYELQVKLKTYPDDLSKSFSLFFRQFSNLSNVNFQNEERFITWLTWLMIDMSRREKFMLNEKFDNNFESNISLLRRKIDDRFQIVLGHNYSSFENTINDLSQAFCKYIEKRHNDLREDPFFPALKNTINQEIWHSAINNCINEITEDLYEEPIQMMVLHEEKIMHEIRSFYVNLPQLLLYYLSIEDLAPRIRQDELMEGLAYASIGTEPNAYWPIEVYCWHK